MDQNQAVLDYWGQYYGKDHCRLCGNSGVLDTRGVATAAGVPVGGVFFCICPNGQSWRAQDCDPDDILRGRRVAPKAETETVALNVSFKIRGVPAYTAYQSHSLYVPRDLQNKSYGAVLAYVQPLLDKQFPALSMKIIGLIFTIPAGEGIG